MKKLTRTTVFAVAKTFAALMIGVFFATQPCFALDSAPGKECGLRAAHDQPDMFVHAEKISALKHVPQTIETGFPPFSPVSVSFAINTENRISAFIPHLALFSFAKFSTSTFF
jgi:hypothetical protein